MQARASDEALVRTHSQMTHGDVRKFPSRSRHRRPACRKLVALHQKTAACVITKENIPAIKIARFTPALLRFIP